VGTKKRPLNKTSSSSSKELCQCPALSSLRVQTAVKQQFFWITAKLLISQAQLNGNQSRVAIVLVRRPNHQSKAALFTISDNVIGLQ